MHACMHTMDVKSFPELDKKWWLWLDINSKQARKEKGDATAFHNPHVEY